MNKLFKTLSATLVAVSINAVAWDDGYKYPLCVKWPEHQTALFDVNESGTNRLWLRNQGNGPEMFGTVIVNGEQCKIDLVRFSGRENLTERRVSAAKTAAARLYAEISTDATKATFVAQAKTIIAEYHPLIRADHAEILANQLQLYRGGLSGQALLNAFYFRLLAYVRVYPDIIGFKSVSSKILTANCPSGTHKWTLKALPVTPDSAHFLTMKSSYEWLEPGFQLWINNSDPTFMICPVKLVDTE